jgi:hypothetical protein
MLAHGQDILQTPQKPTTKSKDMIRKKKILINDKRVHHSLHLWKGANGMTAHFGFVKKSTKVLFGDTRHHQSFDIHPFFRTIPHACIRDKLGK